MQAAPVLTRGAPGEWDSVDALNPSVIESGGTLLNFYSGYDGKVWRTGLAVSRDGQTFEKRGMVLQPDRAWESNYIAANGSALHHDGKILYWYQAGEHDHPVIGLAVSQDGRNWSKQPGPVLGHGPYMSWDEGAVADPYVLAVDDWLYLYYLGEDRARRQRLGSGAFARWGALAEVARQSTVRTAFAGARRSHG